MSEMRMLFRERNRPVSRGKRREKVRAFINGGTFSIKKKKRDREMERESERENGVASKASYT